MRHEWLDTQNGVVAPESSVSHLYGCQTGGKQRRVKAIRELLHSGKERLTVDNGGCGLQDTHVGFPLHQLHHFHDGSRAQQAVGIQNNHIAVTTAPTPQKVRNVAAFEIEIDAPSTIEQPPLGPQFFAQPMPLGLFL